MRTTRPISNAKQKADILYLANLQADLFNVSVIHSDDKTGKVVVRITPINDQYSGDAKANYQKVSVSKLVANADRSLRNSMLTEMVENGNIRCLDSVGLSYHLKHKRNKRILTVYAANGHATHQGKAVIKANYRGH